MRVFKMLHRPNQTCTERLAAAVDASANTDITGQQQVRVVPFQDMLTGSASLVIRCQKPLIIQQTGPHCQAN